MGFEKDNGTSRPADRAGAAPSSGKGDRNALQALVAFLETTSGGVQALADIYGDRLRASTRETVWKIGVAVIAGVAAMLWIGSATLATVRGLCGAVTFLSGGEEWLGNLAGGALALALAAGAIAACSRWSDRALLKSLERKYGKHDENSTAPDSTPVPGPPAGAGDAKAARSPAGVR